MGKLYEHLHVDISPHALEYIANALDDGPHSQRYALPPEQQAEVQNFISECRARVQHANAGIEDPPENCTCPTVPGRSDNEDWL